MFDYQDAPVRLARVGAERLFGILFTAHRLLTPYDIKTRVIILVFVWREKDFVFICANS